jgi:hypothetical protein
VTAPAVRRVRAPAWRAAGSPPLASELEHVAAVAVEGFLDQATCRDWARRVRAARRDWVADFDGEQFALGRAFYTHLETDRSCDYFRDPAGSDRTVERHLPGMQAAMRSLFAALVGGAVRQRLGFCGPGVHVFPAGEKVARAGGVVHFDVEGLSPLALARRSRALTLIVCIQPPRWGGGLRLWDRTYGGTEEVTEKDLAAPARTYRYEAGAALLMESYRLHQIRPFRGKRDRITATMHAVETDRGVWETWF